MEPANPAPHVERILLVDDAPANLAVLTGALEPEGYDILAAPNGAAALKVAQKARPDLILLDLLMPGMDGLETCRRLKAEPATSEIPVIFITARHELESVREAFAAGAVDYVVKPFEAGEVLVRVATHLRISRLSRELREKNRALEQRTAELSAENTRRREAEKALQIADDTLSVISGLEASRWSLAGMIGASSSLRRMVEDVRRLGEFPHTTVLITGESGTGKELVARAIHFGSTRARAPLIPVNCVAIPAELAESMLFGHVKGAFTGATSDRKGYFELAHGGTLFLDEIGDMPVGLQVKLLRVLEDGCVTPVGSSESRKVDVRVIAATNADLEGRIASGHFRQDLFFRLARFNVRTPPLRERLEDVPKLAEHFLRSFAVEMGRPAPPLSPASLAALQRHDYPGNVRELRNIVEGALIGCDGASIEPHHLRLPSKVRVAEKSTVRTPTRAEAFADLPLNLAEAEDLLIQRALDETGGNVAEAARLLGVHRTRIYRKFPRDEVREES